MRSSSPNFSYVLFDRATDGPLSVSGLLDHLEDRERLRAFATQPVTVEAGSDSKMTAENQAKNAWTDLPQSHNLPKFAAELPGIFANVGYQEMYGVELHAPEERWVWEFPRGQ